MDNNKKKVVFQIEEDHRQNQHHDPQLQKCLELLNGPTDEEKFVGLLLITKIMSSTSSSGGEPDEHDEKLVSIFDAIGFEFIERLLLSSPATAATNETTSTNGNEEKQQYEHFALNLLSSFCKVHRISQRDEILDKLPVLISLLQRGLPKKRKDVSKATNQQLQHHALLLVEDALQCIYGIVIVEKGLDRFLSEEEGFRAVLRIFCKSVIEPYHNKASILRTCMHIIERCIRAKPELLLSSYAKEIAASLSYMALLFKEDQDVLKFQSQDLIILILSSSVAATPKNTPKTAAKEDNNNLGDLSRFQRELRAYRNSSWLSNIRHGISNILSSKLGTNKKYSALMLAYLTFENFGGAWAVIQPNNGNEPANDSSSERKKIKNKQQDAADSNDSSGKFIELLMGLVFVEIRVLLDEMHKAEENTSVATPSSGSKQPKQTTPGDRTILMICFRVIQHSIMYLTATSTTTTTSETGSHDDKAFGWESYLSKDTIIKIQRVILSAMQAIIEYLQAAKERSLSSHNKSSAETILECIKMLCMWTNHIKKIQERHADILMAQQELQQQRSPSLLSRSMINDLRETAKQIRKLDEVLFDLLPFMLTFSSSSARSNNNNNNAQEEEHELRGEAINTMSTAFFRRGDDDIFSHLLPFLLSATSPAATTAATDEEQQQQHYFRCMRLFLQSDALHFTARFIERYLLRFFDSIIVMAEDQQQQQQQAYEISTSVLSLLLNVLCYRQHSQQHQHSQQQKQQQQRSRECKELDEIYKQKIAPVPAQLLPLLTAANAKITTTVEPFLQGILASVISFLLRELTVANTATATATSTTTTTTTSTSDDAVLRDAATAVAQFFNVGLTTFTRMLVMIINNQVPSDTKSDDEEEELALVRVWPDLYESWILSTNGIIECLSSSGSNSNVASPSRVRDAIRASFGHSSNNTKAALVDFSRLCNAVDKKQQQQQQQQQEQHRNHLLDGFDAHVIESLRDTADNLSEALGTK